MADPIRIRVLDGLAHIAPAQWDALAHGPRTAPLPAEAKDQPDDSRCEQPDSSHEATDSLSEEDTHNPFISHAFLHALERSGSVGGRSGWDPLHLIAEGPDGQLLGAVPVYAKAHSRGEYVFDHAFAEAWHRAGGQYYPKLQISVPFTPATGRRLLIGSGPGPTRARIAEALLAGLEGLRARLDASSIHATFLTGADRADFAQAGYLPRHDQQFHFENAGYGDFSDFLASLRSDKRKALKRERREALSAGLQVEWLTGSDITEAHWDAFFAFYMETGSRKWGTPYLTRAFFSLIGQAMSERILLIMARRNGRLIAGALNLIGANTLYGRHWGAIEHHPFLHFELCYYQAIDFALQHGLKRVEAGAQGEHKLARGYRPVRTCSMHRFADPQFHAAVSAYLKREREAVDQAEFELSALLPFRATSR